MLQSILFVGIGGFFGSILRYLITLYIDFNSGTTFPFGTLTVNIMGSFLIGIIIAISLQENLNNSMRILRWVYNFFFIFLRILFAATTRKDWPCFFVCRSQLSIWFGFRLAGLLSCKNVNPKPSLSRLQRSSTPQN